MNTQATQIQIAILEDVLDSIQKVTTPSEGFSTNFRDLFFTQSIVEQAVNEGLDSITSHQIREACKVARRILRDEIKSWEDARVIEGILEFGRSNGYKRIIDRAGFDRKYAFWNDTIVGEEFPFTKLVFTRTFEEN